MPDDFAERAAALKMPAMAVCDRDGVYGAPRFYQAAKEAGMRAIVGSELTMEDGFILPVLVESQTGYRNLSRLITRAKLRGTKEHAPVRWSDLPEFAEGLVALFGNAECGTRNAELQKLLESFGREHLFVEIQRHRVRGEQRRNQTLIDLARHHRLPLLATNGVTYATSAQREVADVFTCLRHHTHLDAAGRLLEQNAERHLKSGDGNGGAVSRSARRRSRIPRVSRSGWNSRSRISATSFRNFPWSRATRWRRCCVA